MPEQSDRPRLSKDADMVIPCMMAFTVYQFQAFDEQAQSASHS